MYQYTIKKCKVNTVGPFLFILQLNRNKDDMRINMSCILY